jgi:hypothetical protein
MKYIIYLFLFFVSFNCFSQGSSSAVPTFHSCSIFWSGHGQTAATAQIKFRKQGDVDWRLGLDLWRDSRSIASRPSGEYRGSLIYLEPSTIYEVQMSAGTATSSLTFSTWSEVFPEAAGVTTLTSPTTITQGGSPTAYKVYTGNISGGNNNIVVNASYVIIRDMVLTNAGTDAILLNPGVHDIIIERNDISGWCAPDAATNNQAAVRGKQYSNPYYRIIVQRNKIHDPRVSATAWSTTTGGDHPAGPNGINWEYPGPNNVIRYNSFYSTNGDKYQMDNIGGSDNFTTGGFPGANSDVYANFIECSYDDGAEIEGSGLNVRVWGNFINKTFTGVATATCSVGPLYVFNNITNVGQRMKQGTAQSIVDGQEDRGPFNKTGSQDASVRGGRVYLFHNTVLQPKQTGWTYSRGLNGGIVDNGGPVTNVVSKNNIWTSAYTNKGGKPIAMWQGGGQSCTSENDLLSPNETQGTFTITNRITGTPLYNSSIPLTLDENGYFLASNSPGKGKAVRINNFNDADGADIGAYNGKKLEFGVNAYKGTTPPPPVNQLPVCNAGLDLSITLPTNSVTLSGSGSDPDGSLISYKWEKITGNNNYSFSDATKLVTTVSNLTQGVYVFRLTVTDDKGATSSDDVSVTVNAAPPTQSPFGVYQDIIIKYSDSTTNKIRVPLIKN